MGARIQGDYLVIKLPLEEPRPSSTGKTLLIASTRGVQRSKDRYEGKTVSFVANAFVDADGAPSKKESKPAMQQSKRKGVEDDEQEED